MFDFSFSELLVIGVVALLVIGPERLPKVARTAGHLLGRLQRYVASVKSDINREIQLDELRKAGQSFKESVESAAKTVDNSAADAEYSMRDEIASPAEKVLEAMAKTEGPQAVTEAELKKLRQTQEDAAASAGSVVEARAAPQEHASVDVSKTDKS